MKKLLLLIPLCIVFIFACSKHDEKKQQGIITVTPRVFHNTLYYTGTIRPLQSLVVTSPAEGVVIDMPIQYGEKVKKGQLLFVISSRKFLADYKAAFLAFLKAKSDYHHNQSQLSEGKFLHDNQLISDDDFKTRQSNYYTSQLGFLQAKDALKTLLRQSANGNIDLNALDIAQIDKITKAMHFQQHAENLHILAPADGILLAPTKSEEENKKVNKGDAVKEADVLAILGDLSGISIRVKVNELIINQLKPGQKVAVTGIAFPEITLNGEIARVDRQGEAASGGLPTFSIEVNVPQLASEARELIHVGMSAKVAVNVSEEERILLPFNALKDNNGQAYVNLLAGKQIKKVAVKTGKTTLDEVTILSGLNPGDKVVIAN